MRVLLINVGEPIIPGSLKFLGGLSDIAMPVPDLDVLSIKKLSNLNTIDVLMSCALPYAKGAATILIGKAFWM